MGSWSLDGSLNFRNFSHHHELVCLLHCVYDLLTLIISFTPFYDIYLTLIITLRSDKMGVTCGVGTAYSSWIQAWFLMQSDVCVAYLVLCEWSWNSNLERWLKYPWFHILRSLFQYWTSIYMCLKVHVTYFLSVCLHCCCLLLNFYNFVFFSENKLQPKMFLIGISNVYNYMTWFKVPLYGNMICIILT